MVGERQTGVTSSQALVHRARLILVSLLFTFISPRILTFLIMSRRIPDFYLHLGGTHVHHLNHGIFLPAGVGAYLLFRRPSERGLKYDPSEVRLTRIVFFIVTSTAASALYLRLLSGLIETLRESGTRKKLLGCKSSEEMWTNLRTLTQKTIPWVP